MKATEVRDDVRTAILCAAGRLLTRYGYRKTTVDDIAQEAGVGKGTIYLHFRSKEDVALSFMDEASASLYAELRRIAGEASPAADRLQRMLVRRVLYWFDFAQRFSNNLEEIYSALRPLLLLRRDQYREAEAVLFEAVLRDGAATGQFDAPDPPEETAALMTATNALLPFNLTSHQLRSRADVETRSTTIARLMVYGLATGASRAEQPAIR